MHNVDGIGGTYIVLLIFHKLSSPFPKLHDSVGEALKTMQYLLTKGGFDVH